MPNLASAACLLLFVLATYLALWLLRHKPFPGIVPATICIVVVVFLFLRRYTFLELDATREHVGAGSPRSLASPTCCSNSSTWSSTSRKDNSPPLLFSVTLNYQGLCFTFTAGPIQRYNDFHQYWTSRELPVLDARETLISWKRLLTG